MATAIEYGKVGEAAHAIPCADGTFLSIQSISTGRAVWWNAGEIKMQEFSDVVTPTFTTEPVYGRMDPITTYQGTTRKISLTFKEGPYTPAAGGITNEVSMAKRQAMLRRSTGLSAMQYPTYQEVGNATSISRPPLVRVWFGNLIRGASGGGLLCAMNSAVFTGEYGFNAASKPAIYNAEILPKSGVWSLGFDILHEQAPGWSDDYGTDASKLGVWMGGNLWGPQSLEGLEIQRTTTPGASTPGGLEGIPEAERLKYGAFWDPE